MSKRTYNEFQAWSIFFGGLIIGIVITSIFWAYITSPKDNNKDNKSRISQTKINQTENVTGDKENAFYEKPTEFIFECRKIDGTPKWDSTGYKSCFATINNQMNMLSMNLFCKKYNLNLSFGSFGIKCEGIS